MRRSLGLFLSVRELIRPHNARNARTGVANRTRFPLVG